MFIFIWVIASLSFRTMKIFSAFTVCFGYCWMFWEFEWRNKKNWINKHFENVPLFRNSSIYTYLMHTIAVSTLSSIIFVLALTLSRPTLFSSSHFLHSSISWVYIVVIVWHTNLSLNHLEFPGRRNSHAHTHTVVQVTIGLCSHRQVKFCFD